jgi:glycine/D-amino acid oxidase-like deaminating enzyme
MDLKSGYPLSLIRNGLVANYPKLEKDIRTDVAIIGGGISGALTAWHLTMKGISCIVTDARSIGLGSTCASTSILQYELDTPLHILTGMIGERNAAKTYLLCREAIDKLVKLGEKIGFQGIDRRQSLYYAAAKKDLPFLEKEFTARKRAGLDVRYLKEQEMPVITGFAAPAAILSEDGAQTNAYLLTHCLHQYAIKKGLQVYDRSPVVSIRHHRRSVELKTANGKKIKAGKLVFATGYETVNYIDQPIVKLHSTYAVASEPLSEPKPFWKKDRILWNTADPYLYISTTEDNRIVIGGRDEAYYSPVKRDKLIKTKTRQLSSDFGKLFPGINFIPEFSWTGTFGSTKDGMPYIGSYRKRPHSYFALGFGGNGIIFSLIAAEMIAGFCKGKKQPNADLFSFER